MQKVPQELQTVFMSILSYSKTGTNNVQLLICNGICTGESRPVNGQCPVKVDICPDKISVGRSFWPVKCMAFK